MSNFLDVEHSLPMAL